MRDFIRNISVRQWILLGIVGALLIVVIVLGLMNLNGKEGENSSSDILKPASVENLKIDHITLSKQKKLYVYEADIVNSDVSNNIESIDIIFKDKEGKEIVTLLGYIGNDIKANETIRIQASTEVALTKDKIGEIEYKVHK